MDIKSGMARFETKYGNNNYNTSFKNGGKMTYAQYLLNGGLIDPVKKLAQLMQSDTQLAEQYVQELAQTYGPDQTKQIIQAAQQLLQGSETQTAKRGAKIQKACGGKKFMQQGSKVRKAGTGCTCALKRQGGKIIEIDSCTGKRIR